MPGIVVVEHRREGLTVTACDNRVGLAKLAMNLVVSEVTSPLEKLTHLQQLLEHLHELWNTFRKEAEG